MRTHKTHKGASFTALSSPLLYSRCLWRLYLQRCLLLSMSMLCLLIANDRARAATCTKAHRQHSTIRHSMQMEQHGSESAVWHAVANTALLIEVEDERRVRPGHTGQQEATSKLQAKNIRVRIPCCRRIQHGLSPRRRCRNSRTSEHSERQINDAHGNRWSCKTCNGADELAV